MMRIKISNQFKQAVIDDVTSTNLDPGLQAVLLDCFEYAMKTLAVTLVREAEFDTSDFATTKKRGGAGFVLHLRRSVPRSRESWQGEFTNGTQRMEVMGHLE